MSDLPDTVDVAIIGSGIGGSTIAYGLAGSGARIAIFLSVASISARIRRRATRGRSSGGALKDAFRLSGADTKR